MQFGCMIIVTGMKVILCTGPSIGQGSIDSARQNLAASFVSGLVNAAFGKDKLLTEDGNTWLYKNKEHGSFYCRFFATFGALLRSELHLIVEQTVSKVPVIIPTLITWYGQQLWHLMTVSILYSLTLMCCNSH